jgi:NAD(P)-dependent dehydrogenase (short-subunit alcohol dehydrogenase family)
MALSDLFRYDGKRVLIVGGASGMGAAAAEIVRSLGADVSVMDVKSPDNAELPYVNVDLRNQASIEAALEELGGPVDVLFSCSGIAGKGEDVVAVNFVGQRHLISKIVERGGINRGGAITMISSTAGNHWEEHVKILEELLEITGFDAAMAYVKEHPEYQTYRYSKQVCCAYVARESLELLKHGIRINAVMPGPTDTPLARANAEQWLGTGVDYRAAAGLEVATPDQMGSVLAFLGSDAASYISGSNIVCDCGRTAAQMMNGFEPSWWKEAQRPVG